LKVQEGSRRVRHQQLSSPLPLALYKENSHQIFTFCILHNFTTLRVTFPWLFHDFHDFPYTGQLRGGGGPWTPPASYAAELHCVNSVHRCMCVCMRTCLHRCVRFVHDVKLFVINGEPFCWFAVVLTVIRVFLLCCRFCELKCANDVFRCGGSRALC